jgi:hypothetical protein
VTYRRPITDLLRDNSVKDMQELEDARFLDQIEAMLVLKPPYWRWCGFDGIVHVTGLSSRTSLESYRETKCGLILNPAHLGFPRSDHPGSVTCIVCLAE